MNYTTNYHLPQWVETDRIQMEHFNQAFSDIDEAMGTYFGTENDPWVWGSVQIPSSIETGTTLVSFDFNPKLVIAMIGTPAVIFPGCTGQVLTAATTSTPTDYCFSLRLSLDKLVLTARGSSVRNPYTCYYLARR